VATPVTILARHHLIASSIPTYCRKRKPVYSATAKPFISSETYRPCGHLPILGAILNGPPHSSLFSSSFIIVVLLIPPRCPPHSSSLSSSFLVVVLSSSFTITIGVLRLLLSACFIYYYQRALFITIGVRCCLLSALFSMRWRACLFLFDLDGFVVH